LALFLLKYWKILLPAAIAVGMGIWVGILKFEIAGLETTIAQAEAAKQKEIAEARALVIQAAAEDKANNEAIANRYRERVVALAQELQNAEAQINATGSTTGCVDSDAGRAFTRSLRSPGGSQAVPR
jgi:regulator of protease activity HflC (stomatin/prohibitin superfamily)